MPFNKNNLYLLNVALKKLKTIYFIQKMRAKNFILPLLLIIASGATAQKTVRVNAIKANDYGVVYSLPKTSFVVELLIKKSTYQRGDFYPYAQRYLAVDNPVIENRVVYTLESVEVANKGIPDKNNSFMVEFRSKSVEPFVYLREEDRKSVV